ncbi:MAG: VOC family protein [Actinomycetota bacterium]|nr:VOC family protein [Actinomycetota bacterium]
MAKSDLEIDHVIVCVPDLDRAAESFLKRFGLRTLGGGRHAGLGTANRIIPLGGNYLELLTVVDRRAARANPFGIWATVMIEENSMRPAGLCLRTENIEALTRRLGLKPEPMSRTTSDGVELRWQTLGLEQTLTRGHPFFIQWDTDMADHPGARSRAKARSNKWFYPVGPTSFGAGWAPIAGSPSSTAHRGWPA